MGKAKRRKKLDPNWGKKQGKTSFDDILKFNQKSYQSASQNPKQEADKEVVMTLLDEE